MADLNPKVLAMVERALKKNPDLKSKDLQAEAVKIDKRVGALSGRQFHAQYALQVRRRLAGTKPKARKKKKRAARRTKRTAARRPQREAPQTSPALALLTDSYESKKAALDTAIDAAFKRAVRADSVSGINDLLARIDREAASFKDA